MRGDLVALAPIQGDDDYALMAAWAASTKSIYSQGSPTFLTAEQLKTFLSGQSMNFLMVRTHEGETIGAVNWRCMAYQDAYTIGVGIGDEALWGGGYGMEAVFLLMEYLFHTRKAHRLHLEAGLHNKQVMQLFTSGAIHIEGILRDYFFVDGEYHDAVIGSILRAEYYRIMPPLGYPRDVVPAEDKREARRLLSEFLTRSAVRLDLSRLDTDRPAEDPALT